LRGVCLPVAATIVTHFFLRIRKESIKRLHGLFGILANAATDKTE
jgi:hypothetical protein